MIRKGKDFYVKNYEKVMELHKQGLGIKEISEKLNMSYSAVYSWIKTGKIPEKDSINKFLEFLDKNGPTPVIVLKELFPSYDDLYQNARSRGFNVNRYSTSGKKALGKMSVWFYLDGQEEELKVRIIDMVKRYKELKEKLISYGKT